MVQCVCSFDILARYEELATLNIPRMGRFLFLERRNDTYRRLAMSGQVQAASDEHVCFTIQVQKVYRIIKRKCFPSNDFRR